MFISEKVITVRDFGAYCGGMDIFTDSYEIIDWHTSAHYRYDPSTERVSLDGEDWGTLENLLDEEIIEMGMKDKTFIIQVG